MLLFVALSKEGNAQELNCQVTILTPNIQLSDRTQIDNLKNAIREFMNNTRWTQEAYSLNERIECNLLFTITSITNDQYSGTLQIQSSRPIYGVAYNSLLLNILDKNLNFTWKQFQQLEYVKGSYVQDLTSICAFYAYVILGMDADSYSPNGGTIYFNEANAIVQSAQTSGITGWKAGEKNERNRYMMVFEILNEQMANFRAAIYMYHRKGFDQMAEDVEEGRGQITKSLDLMRTVYKFQPFAYVLNIFFIAKRDELIQLYKQAPGSEKQNVSNALQEMDVMNTAKYQTDLR
jgi:hypothetical protein